MFRDLIGSAIGLHSRNGSGWSVTEASKGRKYAIARQPPSNQSLSCGLLHKGIIYHGRGWTGTGGGRQPDEGGTGSGTKGSKGGTGQRDGTADPTDNRLSAITEHGPHPTGLPPTFSLR